MSRATLAGMLMLAGTLACSPASGVYLKVEAPLATPTQADDLHISISRAGQDGGFPDRHYPLTAKTPFPVTLTLTTDDRADLGNPPLDFTVRALLDGGLATPWSERTVEAPALTSNSLTPVDIQLCDPTVNGCS